MVVFIMDCIQVLMGMMGKCCCDFNVGRLSKGRTAQTGLKMRTACLW